MQQKQRVGEAQPLKDRVRTYLQVRAIKQFHRLHTYKCEQSSNAKQFPTGRASQYFEIDLEIWLLDFWDFDSRSDPVSVLNSGLETWIAKQNDHIEIQIGAKPKGRQGAALLGSVPTSPRKYVLSWCTSSELWLSSRQRVVKLCTAEKNTIVSGLVMQAFWWVVRERGLSLEFWILSF